MRWKAFWLEPVEQERVWLRRFHSSADTENKCPLPWGYHDHQVFLKDRPHGVVNTVDARDDPDRPSNDSPLWPTHCACGYVFQEDDRHQVFNLQLYAGALDGKLYTLRDAPPGAMWDATWAHNSEYLTGPDGLSLHVKLPNEHDWCVDQECSNCTRTQWLPTPEDPSTRRWMGRTHYCWIRHGDPRTGNVHVDKNGNTCQAGAGSIQSGSWHGYLHDGWVKDDVG